MAKIGRPKGSPNKRTEEAEALARRLGIDPFEILLRFAKGDWKGLGYENECYFMEKPDGAVKMGYVITPETRVMAAKEAVKYLRPQRKAIEHSGPDGGPIEHKDMSKLTEAELDARIDELTAKRGQGKEEG